MDTCEAISTSILVLVFCFGFANAILLCFVLYSLKIVRRDLLVLTMMRPQATKSDISSKEDTHSYHSILTPKVSTYSKVSDNTNRTDHHIVRVDDIDRIDNYVDHEQGSSFTRTNIKKGKFFSESENSWRQ